MSYRCRQFRLHACFTKQISRLFCCRGKQGLCVSGQCRATCQTLQLVHSLFHRLHFCAEPVLVLLNRAVLLGRPSLPLQGTRGREKQELRVQRSNLPYCAVDVADVCLQFRQGAGTVVVQCGSVLNQRAEILDRFDEGPALVDKLWVPAGFSRSMRCGIRRYGRPTTFRAVGHVGALLHQRHFELLHPPVRIGKARHQASMLLSGDALRKLLKQTLGCLGTLLRVGRI